MIAHLPQNSVRLFTCGQSDFLSHNQGGYLPYAIEHSWEKAFSTRMDPAIPSLDESIAAGYGVCWNRARGVYRDGRQPMTVRAPGTGQKYGSEPRGLDCWQSNDDFVPATRKRTDACRKRNVPAICYVGGLPLNSFTGLKAAQRDSKIDAMVRWVVSCGFTHVGLDLTALDSREWGKSPSMRLAEALLAAGVGVLIESQPFLHPGIFAWIDGRFGVIADPAHLNDPKYLSPSSAGSCLKESYLWIQGSVPPDDRVRIANDFTDYRPIIDFAGIATNTP